MKEELNMNYKEYKTCSRRGCVCTQSLKSCPICRKLYCWQCMELTYDKEGKCSLSVCPDCIAENPFRFTGEVPHKLNNATAIINKLMNKEPLTEEETSNFINHLDSFSS